MDCNNWKSILRPYFVVFFLKLGDQLFYGTLIGRISQCHINVVMDECTRTGGPNPVLTVNPQSFK